MMMGVQKRNAAPEATGNRVKTDLAKINDHQHSDPRVSMQRRLAMKVASSAGLSMAVALCIVALACDGGAR
jgi:hypothetical protein